MRRARVIAALAIACLLTGCGLAPSPRGSASDDAGPAIGISRLGMAERGGPLTLSGEDLQGAPVSVEQWRGQVVVINVWGSWCPPCREETPTLSRIARELDGEVAFLGIAVRESAAASLAFTRRLKVPYPSISDSSGALLTKFADSLPAVAVPTTYILDAEGRVAVRVLDKVTYSTLTALIEDVRVESEDRR